MKSRLIVFVVLTALWLIVVGARLYQVQVDRFDEFVERAADQQTKTVKVIGPRGTIYDRRGHELAVSLAVDSAFADPSRIADPEAVALVLARILDFDEEERTALATRLGSGKSFVWIARKIEPEVSRRLRELELPGLGFERENRRYYPLGTLLCHVLGYTGTDGPGLSGLEFQYEEALSGEVIQRMLGKDVHGASFVDDENGFIDPDPGRSLHLTVDSTLQYIVEKELRRAVEEWGARAGSVVMLDPVDSAVLAMASYPTFDPNTFNDSGPEDRINRAVRDSVEPGSTFKAITAAAVFEASVVHPDDVFYCGDGSIVLGGTRIRDHKAFGELTFRKVIAFSSNVGVIEASRMIREQDFYDTILSFGFGRRTGVDLPGENSGIVNSLENWAGLSKAYISFGHEIAVSALQLTNAFAAIANGGRLNTPYVVRALGTPDGEEVLPRPPPREILSSSTFATLRTVLEGVVVEGTATAASVDGYRVAGKTGTAQKVIPGQGYSQELHMASFVGMVPSQDPRLVVLVMIDEPTKSTHGGTVAAPAFSAIVRQAVLYLGIAPDPELWAADSGWIRATPERRPARSAVELVEAGS